MEHVESVDLQVAGKEGGRCQTKADATPAWLEHDMCGDLLTFLCELAPKLDGTDILVPKLIGRWPSEPWQGYQIPHRDFSLSLKWAQHAHIVMIPLTESALTAGVPWYPGWYHSSWCWDIVYRPLRSVTILHGTTIHRGAGGPGRMIFVLFVPPGQKSRMLTVEPEALTELMYTTPLTP